VTQPAEHGYRNFLSLDAIIAEARAVADTEGLEAVSMRVLAKRLGCTPRALYRHVTDKDEVLELLADRALADVPAPRAEVPWPTALAEFFTAMRARLVASPSVAQIVAQQPVAGPEFRRHAERLVGLLLDAGFQPDVAVEAVVALAQFTLGASMPGTGQRLHRRTTSISSIKSQRHGDCRSSERTGLNGRGIVGRSGCAPSPGAA